MLSGAELPLPVVRKQIASSIDLFVHLSRLRDRSRRVTEISEVAGLRDGEVVLQPLFTFREEGERNGRIVGSLQGSGTGLIHLDKLRMAGLHAG